MEKEIYFHVGLSKTASTYLQNKFFNKLEGINYIGNHNYKNYREIIENSNDKKILVSREFDQQFYDEVSKFVKYYPQAKIIIVLRRQDSWMASQYRRYVKNGGTKEFEQFYDIKNDKGLWKIADADFLKMLQTIDELYDAAPLVLLHEDLKNSPYKFLDAIADFTETSYNKDVVSLSAKHKSYSEKQLKFLKKACKIFKNDFRHRNYFLSRGRWLVCHIFLYVAAVTPKFFFSKNPLINPESLKAVRKYFEEDWKKIVHRAK